MSAKRSSRRDNVESTNTSVPSSSCFGVASVIGRAIRIDDAELKIRQDAWVPAAADPTDGGDASRQRRRDSTALLVSFVVFGWLAVLDSAADIIHIRGLSLIQSAAAVVGLLAGAATAYLASAYGPWSWLRPVRRLQRDAAFALLAGAAVFALDRVAAMLR